MKIRSMFKKLFLMYDHSYKKLHLVALCIVFLVSVLFYRLNIQWEDSKTGTLVTTLGILTTFFLIATERINPDVIDKIFTAPKTIFSIFRLKKLVFTDGKLHKNTIFSIIFTNVMLIFFVFVFYLLDFDIRYILIASTVYLFFGFAYMIAIWNLGLSIHDHENQNKS